MLLPGCFTLGEVPIVWETGWLGLRAGAENLIAWIPSLDSPVHSELLYRLHYRGPLTASKKGKVLP